MLIARPLLTVGLAVALGSFAFGQGQGTGIATVGSPHNFVDNIGANELPSAGGWNGREEICRVCHVPHDHNRNTFYGNEGLLWNHALSNATYPMYASVTLDGAQAAQPTGFSKMCLGCHDGTVAIDTFDKYSAGTIYIEDYNAGYQVPGAIFSLSLHATHPISIDYDENADTDLQPKTSAMGASGTIADVLENGVTLQCSSCHDVHDQPGESVIGTHLLRVSQKASQGPASGLCLTCHIK